MVHPAAAQWSNSVRALNARQLSRLTKWSKQSLKTVKALIVLDAADGSRVLSKYYESSSFATPKDQAAFETRLFDKTKKVPNNELIMLDSHLVLYKSSFDLMIYLVAASPDENELMLAGILNALSDALVIILKNQVEKRVVLENIDLVLLAIDETFDEGIALELDPSTIAARVSRRSERDTIPLAEQTIAQAFRTAQESLAKSLLK